MTASVGKFIAMMGACMLMAGCAQTGPPLPPSLELPKPPSDLRAVRKGEKVALFWTEPIRTTDRQTVRYLGPTRICRGLDPEMTECGTPVGVAPLPAAASEADKKPATLSFSDALPATLLKNEASANVIYAVEALNRESRGAGLSNRIEVSAVPTIPAPADLALRLTGDGVVLTWTSAGESLNQPGIAHRYRVYRRDESTQKDAVAGELPVAPAGPMQFLDSTFEWEKTYLYRVTSVSVVTRSPSEEVQVEGDDTAALRVVAHDIFPPTVPTGLQAVYSGEGQKPFIDLIWAPVTNADLAGYNIYRHEPDGTKQKLNSEPVKAPSYRDTAVASGRIYVYSVSAIDVRGNESAASEETSERIP